jgi:predicted transcriptional regulator of viral defense system
VTYRQVLRELAFDTHGVIRTRAAEDAGVPAVEVRKLAARGALTRLGHGVYRMNEAPAGLLDEFAEAVALVGQDAVLANEAVLAALDLAPVNLLRIPVATTRRIRAALPETVEVVDQDVPDRDREDIDGIPAMSVPAALLACRGSVMRERLEEAARKAERRGIISKAQKRRIHKELAQA